MKNLGISVVILCLGCGLAVRAEAAPVFLAQFTATIAGGFGGLPTTTVTGAYLFEALPPIFVSTDMTEAHYGMISYAATVGGMSFPATPLQVGGPLKVINNAPAPPLFEDAYQVIATLSGTYLGSFRLMGAGLDFEKVGNSPLAFTDLGLPTSVADLSGFTEVNPLDHRLAVLSFENLSTGGLFSASAPLSSFTITAVPEPATGLLLTICLAALLGYGASRRWRAAIK